MISASATTPPISRNRRTFGLASPFFGSSIGNSRTVVVSVFTRGLSTCSSMSTLIAPSLGVNLFHLADRSRQVRSRLLEPVQRRYLVVVGACQRILRLDHFDVVRHARTKAVACLIHFFFRKLHTRICY